MYNNIIKIKETLKNVILSLKNENFKLEEQIQKLKFLERQAKVYKSLIFRIGDRMEINKK